MLVGENLVVYELFQFLKVDACSDKCVGCSVFLVTQNSQKKVVRGNAVTAGPHGFLTGIVYY